MAQAFEFDETQMDMNEQELADLDQAFLNKNEQATMEHTTAESYDAFNFWFLIVLLLLFVFFMVLGAGMIARGYQRRQEWASVGYR